MAITGIYHVNINVHDLDRSLAFYRRLGFAVRGPAAFRNPPGAEEGLRIDGGRGRVATLTIGHNPANPVLDLIEWLNPPTDGEPYANVYHAGVARVAFLTERLTDTYRDLLRSGVEFWSAPQVLRTGSGTTLYVCFSDPDGTVLELIEHLAPDDQE